MVRCPISAYAQNAIPYVTIEQGMIGKDLATLVRNHPSRIHFIYLDPDHPRVIVISENKATAINFSEMYRVISVEGVGRGGSMVASFHGFGMTTDRCGACSVRIPLPPPTGLARGGSSRSGSR